MGNACCECTDVYKLLLKKKVPDGGSDELQLVAHLSQ